MRVRINADFYAVDCFIGFNAEFSGCGETRDRMPGFVHGHYLYEAAI